eukprot:TRINITY_DN26654_c0_g1_i2.p1 TRINITY_DN26654_c0_g1~~TRINITY_DN26654_c0_g1_i2.p1  ORF type:complete len:247 (-),score=45.10 TRINITY_DN26654_c0_g1_i2:170-910(-)
MAHEPNPFQQTQPSMGRNHDDLTRSNTETIARNIANWSADEVGHWACEQGFKEYSIALVEHEITGDVLPLLGESQLLEMGFSKVGQRLRFERALKELQRGARTIARNEVLWEGSEHRLGPCGGCLPFGFPCCCCSQPPASYKMNHYKLSVSVAENNCPCLGACLGYSYVTNNIDLDHINDVDQIAEKPPCCTGVGIIMVHEKEGGQHNLYVEPNDVSKISAKIQQGVEEAELRAQTVLSQAPGQVF